MMSKKKLIIDFIKDYIRLNIVNNNNGFTTKSYKINPR